MSLEKVNLYKSVYTCFIWAKNGFYGVLRRLPDRQQSRCECAILIWLSPVIQKELARILAGKSEFFLK